MGGEESKISDELLGLSGLGSKFVSPVRATLMGFG